MDGCTSLHALPLAQLTTLSLFVELSSLKRATFDGCAKLAALPDALRQLKALKDPCLERTPIKALPESILNCGELTSLNLDDCTELDEATPDLSVMPRLKEISRRVAKDDGW
jgi:Leucine-rich repeat (LRR) protein